MRWPKGPPHLALNPPYLFWFVVFGTQTCFPLQTRAFLLSVQFLPLFIITFWFLLSFALSLSLCLYIYIYLSLSLSLLLFYLFLLCLLCFFLFAFFCFLGFVSLFLCLVSLLLFHEKNNIKILSFKVCFSSIPSFGGVFCLRFLSDPFSLSLFFFLILSFVFCSTSMFLLKRKFKNVWSRGGLHQNGVLITCDLQNVKSYHFWLAIFGQALVDVQKTPPKQVFQHIKNLRCYYLVQVGVIIWPKFVFSLFA